MQYYIEKHRHTCGVDLHGRNLYLCVLDQDRQIVLHRRVDCDEERLLRALAPYRDDLVVGVACMFKRSPQRVAVAALPLTRAQLVAERRGRPRGRRDRLLEEAGTRAWTCFRDGGLRSTTAAGRSGRA